MVGRFGLDLPNMPGTPMPLLSVCHVRLMIPGISKQHMGAGLGKSKLIVSEDSVVAMLC